MPALNLQPEEELFRIPSFEDLKSKKWSEHRFNHAFEKALKQLDPKFKLEPMGNVSAGRPKPPRLLIADGDMGQVMALWSVAIFARLIFKKYKKRSINGSTRLVALDDAITALEPSDKHAGTTIRTPSVQGDGSAWDSCCVAAVRELIENPCLEHIPSILGEYVSEPPHCALRV